MRKEKEQDLCSMRSVGEIPRTKVKSQVWEMLGAVLNRYSQKKTNSSPLKIDGF